MRLTDVLNENCYWLENTLRAPQCSDEVEKNQCQLLNHIMLWGQYKMCPSKKFSSDLPNGKIIFAFFILTWGSGVKIGTTDVRQCAFKRRSFDPPDMATMISCNDRIIVLIEIVGG
jgi:hypothetical protein